MASYSEATKVIKSIKIRASPQTSSSSSSAPSSSSSDVKLCDAAIDDGSTRLLIQNHANFKLSGAPVRFMYYQNGMWVDYCGEVVDSLRSGFGERKEMIDLVIEGSNYVFDFRRMVQIDLGTGSQRSIAWIDEREKCFFPKQFIGEELFVENPKIEIEIEINAGSGQRLGKRVREVEETKEKEVTSSYKHGEMSKRQRLADSKSEESPSPRWPNVKLLGEEDGAYTIVRNVFLPAIRKIHCEANITAIHQCARLGTLEKARREIFYKQMEITTAARGTSNTVYAWYGAPAEAISGVLAHGFGVPSKLLGAGANGVGVFLSPLGNCFRR